MNLKNEAEGRVNKFAGNILIEGERYSAFIEKGDFWQAHIHFDNISIF